MKKRFVCLLLAVIMIYSMTSTAFAATDEAIQAAQALYELGLFRGTGKNADGTPIFDLDKTPTRNQAIIMLVRLLGKEQEATWDIPFTDVTDGMQPYIGYAYENGLTKGTSATTYSGTKPIRANQYIAFVLRALGYVSGKDFDVSTSWILADKLGLDGSKYVTNATFTRGDVAIISNNALSIKIKGSSNTLAQTIGTVTDKAPTEQPSDQINNQVGSQIDEQIIVAKPSLYDDTVIGNQITLSWGFYDKSVDGFELYVSESEYGSYEKVTTITNAADRTYTFSGVAGKSYYFKMRAFVISNGKVIYSDYSGTHRTNIPGQSGLVIELPNLPTEVNWYKANGSIYSSARITKITYVVQEYSDGVYISFFFNGIKTGNGTGNLYDIRGDWTLTDKETGIIVDAGSFSRSGLQVNEEFKNVRCNHSMYDTYPKKTYVLEIFNYCL